MAKPRRRKNLEHLLAAFTARHQGVTQEAVSSSLAAADLDRVGALLVDHLATGNAVYLMEAFLHCVEEGRREVPSAILEWLAGGLNKWFETEGESDLARALGLKNAPGKRAPLEEWMRDVADNMLCDDMEVLIHLGASRDEAAEVALDRKANEAGEWAHKISPETLIAKYADKHRSQRKEALEAISESASECREFLSRFNRTYMREKLLSRVRAT
ncbi:hypothetical protein FN976_07890 [Caenimonas sedimenti]|uniref:Uncharacterized protein n=1 Tax=Caenimonas sedimenti TaxID=2596921 RepID=A0A562ZTT9_9BURK|nr:hypothetical protein [Caenimonas sedimenti]TWO71903.1 hypothetical protein FN976_07890 [Caenimonas sedimenti]